MYGVRMPMTRGADALRFAEIVEAIGDNDWSWVVLDFHGVGVAPGAMPMPAFEHVVQERGCRMTADGLREFARANHEVWDCSIVAHDKPDAEPATSIAREDVRLILEGIDSTCWEVHAHDRAWLEKLVTRITRRDWPVEPLGASPEGPDQWTMS